jgi:transcriptional regulator with XRE-family HTH domain
LYTEDSVEIGKRIEQLREEAGMSQSALARAIETSQSAISQIEAGDRNPSFEMLRQIAKALNVSVPHLTGASVEGLTPEEEAHFRELRRLPDKARSELTDYAAYLRHKYAPGAKPPKKEEG